MTDEIPALSPSIAHELLQESPLHAWTIHRLLGNRPKDSSAAMRSGSIIHALLFEDGAGITVIDAPDFRTQDAKAKRDEALAAGLYPVTAVKLPEYETAANRIAESIAALGYDLSAGHNEHRVEWTEDVDGTEVRCSGRLDWVRDDRQLVIDLKTTDGSAHPNACAAKLARTAGHLQDAAYRRAIGRLNPDLMGRVDMVFLFAQTVEPYAVTPIECGGSMRELGEMRWWRAVETWARCLSKGRDRKHWPGYADAPVRVEAPAWAIQNEMMHEEMGT